MEESWKTAHADLLSSLTAHEMAALTKHARRRRIGCGQPVFVAGQEAREIFIVASGCIKLFQTSPAGKEIILWFAFPGELFGVAECMRGVHREISASGKSPSEILAVEQRDFVEFLRRNPEAALRAIGILSARVRTLGSALVELTAENVETRLARLLLRLSAGALRLPCGSRRKSGEICLNLDLTRLDMANHVGASRQTVTTYLARLERDGIVRKVGRHLHLPEPRRLVRLCDRGG